MASNSNIVYAIGKTTLRGKTKLPLNTYQWYKKKIKMYLS